MGLPELAYSTTRIECCACGIVFIVPTRWNQNRRETKASFYCPNGHGQSYTESEADRVRAELGREQRKSAMLAESLAVAERQRKRLEKRAKVGVCPCCHRSFAALARHMATKHPDFAP